MSHATFHFSPDEIALWSAVKLAWWDRQMVEAIDLAVELGDREEVQRLVAQKGVIDRAWREGR